MHLDEILKNWEVDSVVDKTEIADASLAIPQLHSKYFKIFANEKLLLRKYEAEHKALRFEKWEFYSDGPTKEQVEKGWKLPPKGRILKADVPIYLEGDKDLIELSLKIGLQNEKVALVDNIIKSLSNRSYQLATALGFLKFENGLA